MDTFTLVVAGLRRRRDHPDRPGHLHGRVRRRHPRAPRALRGRAEARKAPRRAAAASPSSSSESAALAQLNKVVEKRDFGANLLRDLGCRRPQAQAVRVPRHLGRPRRSASRSCMYLLGFVAAGAPEPGRPGHRLPRRRHARRASGSTSASAARLKAFNSQLPDTVTLIANALRAGSSFLQAIELVVRESRPPISIEFGRVIREVNLGLPFDHRAREHGPPRAVRGLRADGHGHRDPAPGRRQPRRDPRLDRVHDPRADPDQGRDPDPDRAAAHVRLRRRRPALRPRLLHLPRGAEVLRPDVRQAAGRHRHPARTHPAGHRPPGDGRRASSSSARSWISRSRHGTRNHRRGRSRRSRSS